MARRTQHTISLSVDEKKKIDAARGTEDFSPYVRRQLLTIADEEAEYRKFREKKNGKRKENKL